jgi:hypothetical protein
MHFESYLSINVILRGAPVHQKQRFTDHADVFICLNVGPRRRGQIQKIVASSSFSAADWRGDSGSNFG